MSFIVPVDNDSHPARIYNRLVRLPEHIHLFEGNAAVDFLFRQDEVIRGGRRVLGTCCIPGVNGSLSPLFDWMLERTLGRWPDFLIILDHDYWYGAGPLEREILVYHEMLHAYQKRDAFGSPRVSMATGEPVWGIRGHDIEEFNEVVARYGAHSSDLQAFLEAVDSHGNAAPLLKRIAGKAKEGAK